MMDKSIMKSDTMEHQHLETVVTNLKNSIPVWEDFILKATKLNMSLKGTLRDSSGFIEALQKIADIASSSACGGRDVGATLTRFCMRQKSVEAKLRTLNCQLLDSLANPLQDRLEDWRHTSTQLDRERQKELRKSRTDLHKVVEECQRHKRKNQRRNSNSGPARQLQLEFAEQAVAEKRRQLEEMEKASMRRAVLEERRRLADFLTFLTPILDCQVSILSEISQLEELVASLYSFTSNPPFLPMDTEQILSDCTRNSTVLPTGNFLSGRRSSHLSLSSQTSNSSGNSNISNHALHDGQSSNDKRVPSVSSSQDSGFTSHDPRQLNRQKNSPYENDRTSLFDDPVSISPEDAHLSYDVVRVDDSSHKENIYSGLDDLSGSNSEEEEEDETEEDGERTPPSSPTPASAPVLRSTYNARSGRTSTFTSSNDQRRHTIGLAFSNQNSRRPLSTASFKPIDEPACTTKLYPNQAIPAPVYSNIHELHRAAQRKYGVQIDSTNHSTGDTTTSATLGRYQRRLTEPGISTAFMEPVRKQDYASNSNHPSSSRARKHRSKTWTKSACHSALHASLLSLNREDTVAEVDESLGVPFDERYLWEEEGKGKYTTAGGVATLPRRIMQRVAFAAAARAVKKKRDNGQSESEEDYEESAQPLPLSSNCSSGSFNTLTITTAGSLQHQPITPPRTSSVHMSPGHTLLRAVSQPAESTSPEERRANGLKSGQYMVTTLPYSEANQKSPETDFSMTSWCSAANTSTFKRQYANRRSSSTSRSSDIESVTPTSRNETQDFSQPFPRTRCPSSSATDRRPLIPPKPRVIGYSAGSGISNSANQNPSMNSSVELRNTYNSKQERKKRDEACTSFIASTPVSDRESCWATNSTQYPKSSGETDRRTIHEPIVYTQPNNRANAALANAMRQGAMVKRTSIATDHIIQCTAQL